MKSSNWSGPKLDLATSIIYLRAYESSSVLASFSTTPGGSLNTPLDYLAYNKTITFINYNHDFFS